MLRSAFLLVFISLVIMPGNTLAASEMSEDEASAALSQLEVKIDKIAAGHEEMKKNQLLITEELQSLRVWINRRR